MWARTCVPSPSIKRPSLSFANDHADIAVAVGLRGNAIATDVPSWIRSVVVAPSAIIWKGSSFVSSTSTASRPTSSATFDNRAKFRMRLAELMLQRFQMMKFLSL